jgi:hypothetical protein
MKPVDHVMPTVPSNWVRRVEERRRKRDPEKGRQQNHDQKQPPGPDPDGRTHIIDELA